MAKVLVSDDDPRVLQMVGRILEAAGHDVLVISNSTEVPAAAQATQPNVIVLDVMMPVSGFELLGQLREDGRTANIPILFLSGLGEGADRVRGLSEGADDYLVKPFEPAELVLRIERLIHWRTASPRTSPAAEDDTLRFGRYQVLGVLGQGSMGTVYRGLDPRLEREVALKTIRLSAATTESRRQELLGLLRQEAVMIARLSHPNVVQVYDMGDTEDSAFVAMEMVDGVSLGDLLRLRGAMAETQLIPLAAAIASGLALTHARHVIHRDVKPGNVLLGRDGAIKVSDFGLSYVVSSMLQDSTEMSGTPGYVPPEVLKQDPYIEPGDMFGFGATLYESLAGIHPLSGESMRETILNTLHGTVQPLEERMPDLPGDLCQLIMQLLNVDPEQRPDAVAAASQLERMMQERDLRWIPDELPAHADTPTADDD